MTEAGHLGWWGVLLGVLGGAIRISTPFLFVSLGECLTEKSGRVNLGLEGTLVMGAMAAYGISYLSGSPWLGVLIAGLAGAGLGALRALGSGALLVGVAAVRRRERARPRAAVGGRDVRVLPLQCRALRADAGDH